MTEQPSLLEIGIVGRAHGLGGEVAVSLSTNVAGRLVVGSVFETEHGTLSVTKVRPHQDRQLVSFAGVHDRTAAERLKGARLLAPALDVEPDEGYWVHELIGSMVRDPDGVERGVVTSIEANPAADLLVLESGALVPVGFVVSVTDGVVEIDPPDGLFDL